MYLKCKQNAKIFIQPIQMWEIAEQPICRKYHVSLFTRSFFVPAICYLIAFIVPALILVSIGYSWNTYQKQILKPTIKYQNYQLWCLLQNNSYVYDSSFSQETASYASFVSVGTSANQLDISAIIQVQAMSCSLITYHKILLNSNTQALVTIPISFYHKSSDSSAHLSSVTASGSVKVTIKSPILQTSIVYSQSDYQTYAQQFSMIDNSINFNDRNLSAIVNVGYQNQVYSSSTGTTSYTGKFQIESQIYIKYTSLLTNIRTFVPFFMFLWLPIMYFITIPLIRWMLQNKVYTSKVQHSKIKSQ